jgi:alpha-amylase
MHTAMHTAMHTEHKMPWLAVVVSQPEPTAAQGKKYIGDGREILLQGFHWASHVGTQASDPQKRTSWYRVLQDNAAAIKSAGFTWVWFPPPSDSLAPQGYIPRRWNVLDTAYGSEAELRAAIRALEPVRAMADIVLNHRVGVHTAGADFADPPFPDNRAAIAKDDSSGVGTGNYDTGEHHPAGRELDHTNPDVRNAIKTYMNRLKSVGFQGWRYDLTKGYHGRFVGEYNDGTNPEFSVGEFFDGDRQKVTSWLDATGGRTTAFDFPTRYILHGALQFDDYSRLASWNSGRLVAGGLLGYWPSRSVTFLDNHDTEYRRDLEHQYHYDNTRHFPGSTVDMGYAYLLTHPGIPCVFWSHFFDWGQATRQRIEKLIKVRRYAGIHARSGLDIREATKGLYAAFIDGRIAMKLGSRHWSPGHGWQLAIDGDKLAVWVR